MKKPAKEIIKCKYCRKEFEARRCQLKKGFDKYCSRKCSHLARRKRKELFCLNCNKKFEIKISRIKKDKGKYCSKKCFYIHRSVINRKLLKCLICGKSFFSIISNINKGNGKYCSRICFFKSMTNNSKNHWFKADHSKFNNPAWQGGITPLHFMIRNSQKCKQWKSKILERDNYICQKCESKRNLEIHHKKSFSHIFSKFLKIYDQFSPIEDKETLLRLALKYLPFWDINNGITLCKKCHDLTKKGSYQYGAVSSKR